MSAATTTETPNAIEQRGPAAYVAEFVGTFMLVLFVCVIVIINSRDGLGFTDWAVIGLVHAFVLMLIVNSLGGTSGAHFNPAVTSTLTALRKITPADALIYVVVQLAGAVAAALVAKALLTDEGAFVNYGAVGISPRVTKFGGFIVEAIGTFTLMWAIMAAAVNPRAPRAWAGFMIGAALGLGVMAFGALTGAGFNPARAFGPALVSGEFGGAGTFLIVYVVGPIVGGLLAGTGYTALVLRPQAAEYGLEDVAVGPEGELIVERDIGRERPGTRPIDKLD
ncbi:MAG TPA: aquaporin [Solirubrobacteraceae bacterium]